MDIFYICFCKSIIQSQHKLKVKGKEREGDYIHRKWGACLERYMLDLYVLGLFNCQSRTLLLTAMGDSLVWEQVPLFCHSASWARLPRVQKLYLTTLVTFHLARWSCLSKLSPRLTLSFLLLQNLLCM